MDQSLASIDESAVRRPAVAIGYNTCHYAYLFRRNLIQHIQNTLGMDVYVLAPRDEYTEQLEALGVRHVDVPMDMGTKPLKDLALFWHMFKVLKTVRPAVFLGYTVKPNVYGSLASHARGIPVINNIAGLGAAFITVNWLTRVVTTLYRVALARSAKVFFQNPSDQQLFLDKGLVRESVTELIPGSGVDLKHFAYSEPRTAGGGEPLQFLLIARMLRDKGVAEYVEAARILRQRHPTVRFCLLGGLDIHNPAAIKRVEMDAWVAEGIVEYLGVTKDVRPHIERASCVVLPSYREGTSRTLLESAAMGRPIVTTDVPGCREVVDEGVNGFRCRVRDAQDLAEKMERMISLSDAQRAAMGAAGRRKVERQFDEKIVIDSYLAAIRRLIQGRA